MTFKSATRARFDAAELIGCDLDGITAPGASFTHANLLGAQMVGGDFSRATFKSASLNGANMSEGNFTGADFKDASLLGATLKGADLSSARNLTQHQVQEACADGETRLPRGLRGEACRGTRVIIRTHKTGPSGAE